MTRPPSDAREDEKWIEVRRFNDPVEADMARDFLKMHDVRVSVRGNSGATGVLNRFDTVLDIRLVVPESEIDRAREALAAMQSPPRETTSSAYRGLGPEVREVPEEDRLVHKKSPFASVGFGLVFPIGAAHSYAEHAAAGQAFGFAIVGSALLAMLGGVAWLWTTALLLVLTDALASPFAVSRFNLKKIPAPSRQRTWVGVAIVIALVVGYATRGA